MGEKASTILTVTQLTEVIKHRLESDSRLVNCYISGELSNFKHHTSGHMYFTLKDDKSRVRAIMFSSRTRGMTFVPEDGMKVICRGTIGVFERDGQYQIYVDEMQPDGVGALYVAFTQLRDKLAREGLFHEARKKPLPIYPKRIGVVTSPTGAVIRDICSTLSRRYPMAKVILYPALVQGPSAAATIVRGIEYLAEHRDGEEQIDVIIVGRGGGSIEELWPFNEEVVARAIAACETPIISAVGHETDYTIADFVADVRAATPTAAAELAAPHVRDIEALIRQFTERAQTALEWRLTEQKQRLSSVLSSQVIQNPMRMLDRQRQNLDFFESQLVQIVARPVRQADRRLTLVTERLLKVDVGRRVQSARSRLERIERVAEASIRRQVALGNANLLRYITALEALNPLRVLSRGYSVVYKSDESTVVTSTKDLEVGEVVRIRLSDGTVTATVGEGKGSPYVGKQSRLNI